MRVTWLHLFSALALSTAGACQEPDVKPTIGTETNWLARCTMDAECGSAECVCGMCTKTCALDTECPGAPGPSSCVLDAAELGTVCGTAAPAGMCLARCTTSTECSTGLECASGFCLAPSGTGGSGGSGAGGGGAGGTAGASDCLVGPGRTYETIQAAIDGEPDGAMIGVCAGTYLENLTIGHDVSIVGVSGASETTVVAAAVGSVIVVPASVTAAISGLTITGGEQGFETPAGFFAGGGIANLGTLELTDAIVTANSAVAMGGGVFNQGVLTVRRTEISNNSAQRGGGIQNYGTEDGTVAGRLIVEDTTISGCSNEDAGAGIDDLSVGLLDVHDSVIEGNFGAGIFDQRGSASYVNNQVIGNDGMDYADGSFRQYPLNTGGFYIQENRFTMTDTIVTDSRGSHGAGMYTLLATGTISGGSFLRNESANPDQPAALWVGTGCQISVESVDFGEGADDNIPAAADMGNIIWLTTLGADATQSCDEQGCQ